MTKKHFIALADAVRTLEHVHGLYAEDLEGRGGEDNTRYLPVKAVREMLAHFCRMNNAQFKMSRWYDYIDGKCGPNGGKLEAV